jgi:hypothetical protein
VELVNDFGIWKIVAHIAFKFYSGASGTFSTASTRRVSRAKFVSAGLQPFVRRYDPLVQLSTLTTPAFGRS